MFTARTRPLVVIISAAGYENFGDDVILARWVKFYVGWDLALVSGANIDSLVDRELISRIPLDSLDDYKIGQIEGIARKYKKVCVHLTGGGFCNDKFGTAKNVITLIKRMPKNAVIVGTGVSFYPISAETIENLKLISFHHISFRDRFSKDIYNSGHAFLAGDDLIDSFESRPPARTTSRDLYINIQNQFDIEDNILAIADKVSHIIKMGGHRLVFFVELCPGDLDIIKYIDSERIIIVKREDVMAGNLRIDPNDNFIATRFHFRMLAEQSGSTGISIISDDYYRNKHEVGTSGVNFLKNRTHVMSIDEFISKEISMPPRDAAINWRRYLKRIEIVWLRVLINTKWWHNRLTGVEGKA